MYQDYKDLWSAFHAHGVSTSWWEASRSSFTRSPASFIRADPANAHATYPALDEFGSKLARPYRAGGHYD
jgi:hypothetical protein